MTDLEERVREAIDATGLDVKKLAEKIGVTRQAVYDWRKGKGLSQIKAENLVELASLARYEPLWILKGKGPKNKRLTAEQERVLVAMESPSQQKMILGIVESVLQHQSETLRESSAEAKKEEEKKPETKIPEPKAEPKKDSNFKDFKAPGLIKPSGILRDKVGKREKKEGKNDG